MSFIAIGSTFSGLPLRITRSAILPGSSEPRRACSPYCSAAQIVCDLSASSGVIRWSGPTASLPCGRSSSRRRRGGDDQNQENGVESGKPRRPR